MFDKLKNRYIIEGTLSFTTPLHIGSGSGSAETDSTVVKYFNDQPYIPGSSFKGVLRSTVERLAPALGIAGSCILFGDDECGKRIDKELKTREVRNERFKDEQEYMKFILENICPTCRLFGCTYLASKIQVDDLLPQSSSLKTEIRDGVGIDRDTGTAVDGVKYDYEVVPSTEKFSLKIIVENANEPEENSNDLLLLAIGLAEFTRGTKIGGLTSRGLGSCKLIDGKVYCLSLENTTKKREFLNYLTVDNYKPKKKQPLTDFIQTQINPHFPPQN